MISSEYLGKTGWHSFTGGFQYHIASNYKCTVCGRVRFCKYDGHICNSFGTISLKYEQIIPDDVYDDESLTDYGKSFRMIKEEIFGKKYYIGHFALLKQKLCELFEHDVEAIDDQFFKCKCCGKTYITHKEYIDAHFGAKYRGIIDFRYEDPDKNYITSPDEELVLVLPTFEDYLKDLDKTSGLVKTLKLKK